MEKTTDDLKTWCKKNPIGCIAIIAVMIVLIVVLMNKLEPKYRAWIGDETPKEKMAAPSVLAEPNTATAVARAALDRARDRHGMTIRDYEMEAAFLKGDTV